MARSLRIFGHAPYLGTDQELDLLVRFGERTLARVELDNLSTIHVVADISAQADRSSLVTDILYELRRQYENRASEPPTHLLLMTWEKVLNDTFDQVLR